MYTKEWMNVKKREAQGQLKLRFPKVRGRAMEPVIWNASVQQGSAYRPKREDGEFISDTESNMI